MVWVIVKEKAKARKYLNKSSPQGMVGAGVEGGIQGMFESYFWYLICFLAMATGYSWKATARILISDAKLLDHNPRCCYAEELGLGFLQSN